ncbi:MAG: hypothetical protein PHF86_11945 [Candidatus Nanoarchaeia archaeon]|nr:hypothetical protein [Candidatus Nanoarchaeia archaeon]
MDSEVRLLLDRADNELITAKALKRISEEIDLKNNLSIPERTTFYSAVISHAYYSIFYSAKAALLSKGIKISAPFIHNKAYDKFKKTFVDSGKLDIHILEVYETALVRAEDLLQIMKDEKIKRGKFTYKTLPQANKDPAEESINNATLFVSHIKNMLMPNY